MKTLIDIIKNPSNSQLTTFINPYSYLLARQQKKLFEHFNIKIDGILLVKILQIFKVTKVERFSFDMTSLAPIVFRDAIKNNRSIYLIGAKPTIINEAIKNIQSNFPLLNVIGFRDGYIKPEEREETLKSIKQINPDILICGMGTPLQEQFLLDLQNYGWNGIGYTCGGFLHQTAKNIQYYPKWIDQYNLRWAYRIFDEPELFKRYSWEYPKFLFIFMYDFLIWKLRSNKK